MRYALLLTCILLAFGKMGIAASDILSNTPDSVWVFAYATTKNNNHNGLHFAWSHDKKIWYSVGNEAGFLYSDYGRWGSEKRMISPYVFLSNEGVWHCVWGLNETVNQFAHAASLNLVDWGRQSYPYMPTGVNCLQPVITFSDIDKKYVVTYSTSSGKYYSTVTSDFKSYSTAKEVTKNDYHNAGIAVEIMGNRLQGQLFRVSWNVVDKLIKTNEMEQYKGIQNRETTKQDSQRFAGLKPVDATITINAQQSKAISNTLLGIFFEDINYAADGGLYGELIQNRDFEYALSDKDNRDKTWTSTHSWKLKGDNATFIIDSVAPIHENNLHYAVLAIQQPGAALVNTGYDGIAIKKGERYNLSLFGKQLQGKAGKCEIKLVNEQGKTIASAIVNIASGNWKTLKVMLVATDDAASGSLEIQPLAPGKLALDMISLFPEKTFKGRKNGLRADLAQTIADIHPRFVRFPGGCVAHGDGLENIYRWKNTIGSLEGRKPQRNLWNYHQSAGLGYFEYFQFCEDIGAEPVPVVAAGVPCQNSGTGGGGQQGGILMSDMDAYVQDILDLVEYANGAVNTKWGKLRAEAGHPQPFNLKYIGIGNEDLITDVFEERFTMIYRAMKKTHPEITVIGTAGPFFEGTDYVEGWAIANKEQVPMIDEHYYQSPGWFINNQDFYDKYSRNGTKVYLGEYAAHLPGRPNNLETALAEALYMTSLERNGDVVSMTSYAPLLAKEGHTQWNPDLIYFNNTTVKPTVGYYVQQLYGQNSGDEYLPQTIQLSNNQDAVSKRIAVSVVRDSKTKDVIIKLVNLLPVAVTTSLNLGGITTATTGMKTVMQGEPTDKTVKPQQTSCTISETMKETLPPYSFTVIRVKA